MAYAVGPERHGVDTYERRRASGERSSHSSATAVLCGIVTDRPTRPNARAPASAPARAAVGNLERDEHPVETERAVRRVVQAWRQRMSNGIADHAGDPGCTGDHSSPSFLAASMFCCCSS